MRDDHLGLFRGVLSCLAIYGTVGLIWASVHYFGLAVTILASGWLAIGLALRWRIRQNRKRYRFNRTNRTTRAWVRNGGRWFED